MQRSFRERQRQPEWMDQPDLNPDQHQRALRGLARINRFTGSAGLFWPEVRELATSLGRPIRILDVACGAGDVLSQLFHLGKRGRLALVLTGVDISPTAIDFARQQAQTDGISVRFQTLDVLRDLLPQDQDIIICSLFMHHLAVDEAVELLRRMGQATRHLVLVNDLARSRLNHLLVWLGCHLLSRSPIVHYDGPVSVRASFTPTEARQLAERAGLRGAEVFSRFPCRFLLRWTKPT